MNVSDHSTSGTYQLWAELLAIESVEGNVIDPEQDVPFVAMEATMGSLLIATPDEPQVMTDGGQPSTDSDQFEPTETECDHCGEPVEYDSPDVFKSPSDKFWHPECFAEHCYERRSLVATIEGSFKIKSVAIKTIVDGDQEDVERYWAADCPVCFSRHETDDHSEEGRDELVDQVTDCCGADWLPPTDWIEDCDVCGTDHRESSGCTPLTYREPFPDPDEHHYDCSECEWSGDGDDFDNSLGMCPDCGTAAVRANRVATDGGQPATGTEHSDPVLEALDRLDPVDSNYLDPTVAIFDHAEFRPVVAKVGDDLRMLSSALVYAREIDVEDVRKAWDEHGEPRFAPFYTQAHRFNAEDFQEVADLD